ncbi:MAG: hypothetical protein Q4B94_06300 [Pseudomonadota bacterium]|nr:hypothetical protein [Pseudomonadota bacterium]
MKYVSFWLSNDDALQIRIGGSELAPFLDENNYIKVDRRKDVSPKDAVKLTCMKNKR